MNAAKPASELVLKHWGADAPQWVKTIASFSDRESQAQAARKIGRSPALVNQVLKNRYTGDLKGIEERVIAALSNTKIACPVFGDISGEECLKNQKKPYNPSNHVSVRLFRTCRQCPFRLKCKGESNAE